MSETIIASVITGVVTLLGVLLSNGKTITILQVKLEELTREVREHNGFAQRIPALEEKVRINDVRITNLERKKPD